MVFSEEQTKGRGRNDRKWSSNSKGNIYFSFVWHIQDSNNLPKFNILIPLAVSKTLSEYKLEAKIKWPNDVWVNYKKISGMLVDVDYKNEVFITNSGVGININEDMSSNEFKELNSTSVYTETKEKIKREEFLSKLCNYIEELIEMNFDEILDEYLKFDMLIGKEVVVMPKKKEDESSYYIAKAIKIDNEGFLIVQYNGVEKKLLHEEVSIRPKF
jgi:BirA family transcriptional regulator, biotin operon repressor / biotin---[acetyl-CoA-carboxylase] ligase